MKKHLNLNNTNQNNSMEYPDYMFLWNHMKVTKEEKIIEAAELVLGGKEIYMEAVDKTKVPWEWVGCVHYRESGCNFSKHLHNGDSLKKRTVNVPAGRPPSTPPFTWQESAQDALFTLKKLDGIELWDIPTILKRFELYNGTGYLRYHPETPSPYLWSGTKYYVKGKYASDGKFDPELVDKQVGCAPLFRYLTDATLGIAPIKTTG